MNNPFADDWGYMAFLIALGSLAIFVLIKLNEWNYAERKKMTPEERKREDEEAEPW
jgi:hypothetical protein